MWLAKIDGRPKLADFGRFCQKKQFGKTDLGKKSVLENQFWEKKTGLENRKQVPETGKPTKPDNRLGGSAGNRKNRKPEKQVWGTEKPKRHVSP